MLLLVLHVVTYIFKNTSVLEYLSEKYRATEVFRKNFAMCAIAIRFK